MCVTGPNLQPHAVSIHSSRGTRGSEKMDIIHISIQKLKDDIGKTRIKCIDVAHIKPFEDE